MLPSIEQEGRISCNIRTDNSESHSFVTLKMGREKALPSGQQPPQDSAFSMENVKKIGVEADGFIYLKFRAVMKMKKNKQSREKGQLSSLYLYICDE